MTLKYELIELEKGLITLYRLRALRDFSDVKAGDLGGLVDGEYNLDQSGNCWVYYGASAIDHSYVYGDAMICDRAEISDFAEVGGSAVVREAATVGGHAHVLGSANISHRARVQDNAIVRGRAYISGYAQLVGNAYVAGTAITTKCIYVQQPLWDLTATDSHLFIGSEGRTWKEWSTNFPALDKKYMGLNEHLNDTSTLIDVLYRQIGEKPGLPRMFVDEPDDDEVFDNDEEWRLAHESYAEESGSVDLFDPASVQDDNDYSGKPC